MSVVLHDSVIREFFHDETGPLGRHVAKIAGEVTILAHNNLAAHVRSGDAITRLRFAGMFQEPDSLMALVGTDAKHPWRGHPDFSYPLALEFGGVTPGGVAYHYPWMDPALKAVGFRRF